MPARQPAANRVSTGRGGRRGAGSRAGRGAGRAEPPATRSTTTRRQEAQTAELMEQLELLKAANEVLKAENAELKEKVQTLTDAAAAQPINGHDLAPVHAARNAEAFLCIICANEFQGTASAPHAPRLLRCGHTLCTECVRTLMHEAETRHHAKFKCYFGCHQPTYVGSVDNKAPTNYQLLNLLPESS